MDESAKNIFSRSCPQKLQRSSPWFCHCFSWPTILSQQRPEPAETLLQSVWRTFFFRAQAGLHSFQCFRRHFFQSGKCRFCQFTSLQVRAKFAQHPAVRSSCSNFEHEVSGYFPILENKHSHHCPSAPKNLSGWTRGYLVARTKPEANFAQASLYTRFFIL